ncbi:hypothetical protein Lesp02_79710 [Lentzea sp. NBRC 105346]|nr:hypothetical protein [Lentzea sp. NBRC 105346]GLZ35784.1 hypothetical protein Lesp02_79710 [Lentzea sp. NBRC 105346]
MSKRRIVAIVLGIVVVKLIVLAAALYGFAALLGWVFHEANNPH